METDQWQWQFVTNYRKILEGSVCRRSPTNGALKDFAVVCNKLSLSPICLHSVSMLFFFPVTDLSPFEPASIKKKWDPRTFQKAWCEGRAVSCRRSNESMYSSRLIDGMPWIIVGWWFFQKRCFWSISLFQPKWRVWGLCHRSGEHQRPVWHLGVDWSEDHLKLNICCFFPLLLWVSIPDQFLV